MQTRAYHSSPFDAFDVLLRDHVNFVRVNRSRMFDPGFITVILSNNSHEAEQQNAARVPQDKLANIPITKFRKKSQTKEGEEEKCPICLVEFNDMEEIRYLPCKHIYHPSCIDTWLVKNSACPLCKQDVLQGLGLSPANNQARHPPTQPAPHQDPRDHRHGGQAHTGHGGQAGNRGQTGHGGFGTAGFDAFTRGGFGNFFGDNGRRGFFN